MKSSNLFVRNQTVQREEKQLWKTTAASKRALQAELDYAGENGEMLKYLKMKWKIERKKVLKKILKWKKGALPSMTEGKYFSSKF